MRRFFALVLLPAVALLFLKPLPVRAQQPPKDEHAPAHHARVTWEEHFVQANVAHDGHLTLDEAKAGYPTIVRHFKQIDADGKGYVTQNDVRAWRALQKAGRRQPQQAEDPLRPRSAFRLTYPNQRLITTTASHTVARPPDAEREAAAPVEPQR